MLTSVKKIITINQYGMYFCDMRVKLLSLLFILLLSNIAYSQGGWLRPNMNYGIQQYRISLDSTIFLPTGCGAPSGTGSLHAYNLKKAAFYFDSCGHKGYFFDPSLSIWTASGGGQTLQEILQTGSTINIDDTIKLINQPYTGYANSFNLLLGRYSQFNIGDSSKASNAFSFTSNNGSSQSTAIWSNIWKSTPRVSWHMFSGSNTNYFRGYDTSGSSSIGFYPIPTGRQDTAASKYDLRNAGYLSSIDSFTYSTRNNVTKDSGIIMAAVNAKGSGTVTSVSTNAPLLGSGSTIVIISADTTTNTTGLATKGLVSKDSLILATATNGKGRVDSIRLVNSGTIHTSPATFSLSGNTGVVTQTLATQSAYTVFGRGSGSGTPSFVSLDSNYFNGLWYRNVQGSLSAGRGLFYINGAYTLDTTKGYTWTGQNTFQTTSTGTALTMGNGSRTVVVDFSRGSTSPRIIAGPVNSTTFSIENSNGTLDFVSNTGTFGFTNTARGPNGGVVFQAYMDIANGSGSPTKSCGLILNSSGGGSQWPMGFVNNNTYDITGFDFYSNNSGLGTTSFLKCSNSTGTFFNLTNTGKITTKQYQLSTLNTAPSSSTDTGVTGEIRVTASYIYVCTATNTWVRSPLTTW